MTEKQGPDETVETSVDFLSSVINSVADPIFVKDRLFRWVLLNDAFCTFLGKRREDLLGKTDFDTFPPHQAEVFRKWDEDVFGTGRENIDEEEFTDVAGNVHTLNTRKTLHVGAGGAPFVVGVIRDITERKRAEDKREPLSIELASERAGLSDVFELAPAFIATVQGPEHIFKLANPGYYNLVGHRELIDRPAREAVPELADQGLFDLLDRVYATGEPFVGNEMPAKFQSEGGAPGELRYVNFVFMPLRGPDGAVSGILCHGVDVTELVVSRRQLQEQQGALRQSEVKYRTLVEQASESIVIIDREWNIAEINTVTCEVLGYSKEELLSLNVKDVYPQEELAARPLHFEALLNGETVLNERKVRRKDGTVFPIETSARMLPDGSILSINRDITERKRSEETLRFQKTLLESQSEASLDGILVVAPDGKIISCNSRFVELWGIPEEVKDSRSDSAALQFVEGKLANPEEFLKVVRHLYKHPDETHHEEVALKDGRTFERYSAPVRSTEGEYYGRVWYFRNVTERKRAEEELRREKVFSETMIRSVPGVFFFSDVGGQLLRWNENLERVTGYSSEEIRRKGPLNFFAGSDQKVIVEKMRETVLEGASEGEAALVSKTGKAVPHYFTAISVTLGGIPYMLGIGIDLTERRAAEAERERLIEGLREALAEVRTLQEFLPICSYCKKVRDDQNYWSKIESYISERTGTQFSHGICPDCYKSEVEPQFEEFKNRRNRS